MDVGINTILHTKDGRKIGNAIVIGIEGVYFKLKTDYGNNVLFTKEEITELFYIAFSDFKKETHGYSFEEMQELCSSEHKHRV